MDPHLQLLQELQGLDSRVRGSSASWRPFPPASSHPRRPRAGPGRRRGHPGEAGRRPQGPPDEGEGARVPGGPAEEARGQALRGQDQQGVLRRPGRDRDAKVEKDRLEEEILGLMELQERMGRGRSRARPACSPRRRRPGPGRRPPPRSCAPSRSDSSGARSEREIAGPRRPARRPRPSTAAAQGPRRARGGRGRQPTGSAAAAGSPSPRSASTRPAQSGQILACENCGRFLYYQP